MAADTDTTTKPDESTPLISKEPSKDVKYPKSVVYLALLCGFMVTFSFGVTQVPLIWVFRLMTCEAYYESHPEPAPGFDRCDLREIEAGTARAVSLLGASTAFFGVINLFITGWTVKKLGVKSALAIQIFFPAIRLAIQNFGVAFGGGNGIMIIQSSQIITIIGGPGGYLLALNSFITEVVENKERTGALGRLQGCAMFGMAGGFLAGGLISDLFGIQAPFKVTLALFLICCVYVLLTFPYIPPNADAASTSKGIAGFFGPVKMFAPQKWRLRDGRAQTEYGTLLLGIGVFLGVLATGYIPVLLQMYATDVFQFGTTENGYLISLNSLIRGLFLTFAFPRIITAGRTWLDKRNRPKDAESGATSPTLTASSDPITEQSQITEVEAIENVDEPIEGQKPADERETFQFDLQFTKYSLIVDGILTGAASLVTQGWQMYLIAVLLPFASGTGSAAKGTILQMCHPSERTEALSAITLLEMIARLSTTTVFGLLFAAFASIGKTYLVFTCNAAVALFGFCVLLFSRFPPEGSERSSGEHAYEGSQPI